MKILSIETSCDETAISILEVTGEKNSPSFSILADETYSQIKLHEQYGGVFPMLAKREHAKNLPIILEKILKEAKMLTLGINTFDEVKMENILSREEGMFKAVSSLLSSIEKPDINHIVVTTGPGLEPTLWVGIVFAKALNLAWNIPITPVNHMEGHLLSVLIDNSREEDQTIDFSKLYFPSLGLLISGGHTELVLTKQIGDYTKIGQTVDDAVGEAFDKVARVLGLPYPGGPKVSQLAQEGKENPLVKLPRPMLHSGDYNFSFSGIKTAVLYLSKKLQDQNIWDEQTKADIARDFENSCTEVLFTKTQKAVEEYGAQSVIIAGGVAANTHIREQFQNNLSVPILLPKQKLATDNAVMIGIAGYFQILNNTKNYSYTGENNPDEIKADGNWSVDAHK